MLLGEIAAQHLERRLARTVQRHFGLGETAILYSTIITGEAGIYPEYTGLIESEILKEPANSDPQILLARVQREMARTAQIEVLDPLGFDTPSVVVVRAAGSEKIATLTDAAGVDKRWRLGITYEFQTRPDGFPRLATYHLPAGAPKVVDSQQLFPSLENGEVDMIAAHATDGHLVSPDWKVLADDRKVFPSYEACLLVRQDVIAAEPGLRPALAELSGKINADMMRKLNAEIDVKKRPLATVAAEFLSQAGLK